MAESSNNAEQTFLAGMAPEPLGRAVAARPFQPLILRKYLKENADRLVASRDVQARERAHAAFREWHEMLSRPTFRNQTESNLEQAFNAKCLAALGYTGLSGMGSDHSYTLAAKHALAGGGITDVVLGPFPNPQQITPNIRVVVELKGPTQSLDRPSGQNRTPVQQAFDYLNVLDTPNLWAVVTNMVEFRLYHKSRSNTRALAFRLPDLRDAAEFGLFYAAFCAENLLPIPEDPTGYSRYAALAMLEETEKRQQKVGDELYKHYRDNRYELIRTIRADPLCRSFDDALAAAQLLLDRILFIAFAEDRDLLNHRQIIERTSNNREIGIGPWKAFQSVFLAINDGDEDNDIPGYNGSLFKTHPILDNPAFKLPRVPWMNVFRTIGGYDFSDEVNVTVLGHIFEQSITDIETLRQSSLTAPEPVADSADEPADTEPIDKGRSKVKTNSKTDSARKAHGVYYTDDSVTEYLVAAALEPVWADAQAGAVAKIADKASAKAIRAGIAALDSLTLCDPACGSGAFLVAALKWFVRKRTELLVALKEISPNAPEWRPVQKPHESQPFNEAERSPSIVLRNNIYGVDLSSESVEITRLSLWLQSAMKGQKLTDLTDHVKRGNSVVDDPSALPEGQGHLAFDWRAAFPAVFAAGGFDVVVGNPPYVRQESLGTPFKDYVKARYAAFHGMADLYVYFYERGLDILKPGGRLAYIVTNKWMKAGYGEPLRKLFAEKAWVRSVMDFGHAKQFFADADVFPCFLVLQKPRDDGAGPSETAVAVLNRDDVELKRLTAQIENVTILVPRSRFGASAWSLESPKVNDLIEKIRRNGIPLSEYAGVKPYRGVLTGFNEAFLIDTPTRDRLVQEDPRSAEIIKPYLRGQDIKRWVPEWAGLWMIFTPKHMAIEEFSAIYNHLSIYREGLEPKPIGFTGAWKGRASGSYKWYENQGIINYSNLIDGPKILYSDITWRPCFCLDLKSFYINNTGYFIANNDPSLVAVLNSPIFWWYSWRNAVHGKDEALRFFNDYMVSAPVPNMSCNRNQADLQVIQIQIEASKIIDVKTDICDWLRTEFEIEKLSQKLQQPHRLDSDTFVAEVKKSRGRGTALSAAALKQLRDEYRTTIEPARARAAEIARLERELADLVHAAYGLTPEDIDLMWKTAPPRMPVGPPR